MLALALALAAAVGVMLALGTAGDARRTPDCNRSGARLEAANGDVRVVTSRIRRRGRATSDERVLGCWVPTGRRFQMLRREVPGGDVDVSIELDFDIVGDRYVGLLGSATSGVAEWQFASVWDARTRRKLHDADACPTSDDPGVEHVAFGPRGTMAYACRAVGLRLADARGDRELEPPQTVVRSIAMSRETPARLYWMVVDGDRSEVRSAEVATR